MLTRVKTDWPTPFPTSLLYEHNVHADVGPFFGSMDSWSHYSKMEGVFPGTRRYGIARAQYKPVRHLKCTCFPITKHSMLNPNDGYTANTTQFRLPTQPWAFITNGTFPSPTALEINGMCSAAYKQFSAVIPDNVSIANFIWELRDLKSLLPRLLKFKKDFFHKEIILTPLHLKEFAKANYGDNLGTISSNYLAYQFGWKPLLSDIKKLLSLVPNVMKRLAFLKSSRRKWTKVNFRRGDFAPRTIEQPPTAIGPGADETKYVLSSYRADFSASAYMWNDINGLDDGLEVLRAFATALGLNKPGRIIWNAIPYSFFVDWVINIGNWIDGVTTQDFFGGSLKLILRGSSIKEIGRVSGWYRYFNTWYYTGHVLIERYTRTQSFSVPATALWDPDLTGTQQTLLAALTHQAALGARR